MFNWLLSKEEKEHKKLLELAKEHEKIASDIKKYVEKDKELKAIQDRLNAPYVEPEINTIEQKAIDKTLQNLKQREVFKYVINGSQITKVPMSEGTEAVIIRRSHFRVTDKDINEGTIYWNNIKNNES